MRVTGWVFVCTERFLSCLVFWATATVSILALRGGKLRFLYFLVVASSMGCAVWRLGNVLTSVCLCRGRGAGGGGGVDDGFGVDLGSTSVSLVIDCKSRGIVEVDPASFQTWKITPSIKAGSTDWTPIEGGKGHWSILASFGHRARAVQRNAPGKLLSSAYIQSSASSSPSHSPSASRAILNSRRRSGVRQTRTSAEHHLEEAIGIRLRVRDGRGGSWEGRSGGNTTAEFEGLFISSPRAGEHDRVLVLLQAL